MAIRTDGDIVQLARRIEAHLDAVQDLCNLLEDSEHPNTMEVVEALFDEGLPFRVQVTRVVHDCLLHPERWELEDGNLRCVGRGQ